MRSIGTDLIIAVGAIVCIAYGSLVIATRNAVKNDLTSLLGMPQKVANQQKPTLLGDSPPSLGSDIQNFVDYSQNSAIASVVVGVLQLVTLLYKYAFHTYYQTASGGRR